MRTECSATCAGGERGVRGPLPEASVVAGQHDSSSFGSGRFIGSRKSYRFTWERQARPGATRPATAGTRAGSTHCDDGQPTPQPVTVLGPSEADTPVPIVTMGVTAATAARTSHRSAPPRRRIAVVNSARSLRERRNACDGSSEQIVAVGDDVRDFGWCQAICPGSKCACEVCREPRRGLNLAGAVDHPPSGVTDDASRPSSRDRDVQ